MLIRDLINKAKKNEFYTPYPYIPDAEMRPANMSWLGAKGEELIHWWNNKSNLDKAIITTIPFMYGGAAVQGLKMLPQGLKMLPGTASKILKIGRGLTYGPYLTAGKMLKSPGILNKIGGGLLGLGTFGTQYGVSSGLYEAYKSMKNNKQNKTNKNNRVMKTNPAQELLNKLTSGRPIQGQSNMNNITRSAYSPPTNPTNDLAWYINQHPSPNESESNNNKQSKTTGSNNNKQGKPTGTNNNVKKSSGKSNNTGYRTYEQIQKDLASWDFDKLSDWVRKNKQEQLNKKNEKILKENKPLIDLLITAETGLVNLGNKKLSTKQYIDLLRNIKNNKGSVRKMVNKKYSSMAKKYLTKKGIVNSELSKYGFGKKGVNSRLALESKGRGLENINKLNRGTLLYKALKKGAKVYSIDDALKSGIINKNMYNTYKKRGETSILYGGWYKTALNNQEYGLLNKIKQFRNKFKK